MGEIGLYDAAGARPEHGWARRWVIALTVIFCAGLPRAGFVIPGFGVPLPISILLVNVMAGLVLVTRPIPAGTMRLLKVLGAYIWSIGIAMAIGLCRNASVNVLVVEIATFLGQVPAFFVVAWLIRDKRDAVSAMNWLAVSILGASAYGIIQYYVGPSILVPGLTYTARTDYSMINLSYGEASRVLATYGDPNVFAGALVLYLPGLTGMYIGSKGRRMGAMRTLVLLSSIAVGLAALAYCNSRAGYAGLSMAAVLLLWRFRPRMLRIVIPALLVFWVLWETDMVRRITERMMTPGESDPRRDYGVIAWRIVSSHPEGSGLGIHAEVAEPVRIGAVVLREATSVWQSYNSFYLHLLDRAGVLGVVTFVWLYIACASGAWRAAKRRDCSEEWRPVIAGLVLGSLGAQIGLIVNPLYMLPGGGINFWLALGIAYGAGRVFTAEDAGATATDAARADTRLGETT